MELKINTETFLVVDYRDFDEFVRHITSKEFDFVNVEECANDTSHTFAVSGEGSYDREAVEAWAGGKGDAELVGAGEVLDWLCSKGHIKPGNYCIDVFW